MKTVEPPYPNNFLYRMIGVAFIILYKLRYSIKSYDSPRPFSYADFERAFNYDISVVDNWLEYLDKYLGRQYSLENADILELGPGADQGTGIYLLCLGANTYTASLIDSTPLQFYEFLFTKLEKKVLCNPELLNTLKDQIREPQNRHGIIRYLVDKNFILNGIEPRTISLIVSQAAFEHFDSIEETIESLTNVAKPGFKFIAEIDLGTHTRWIREYDPLNIYRYGYKFYNFFKFRGSPNRKRPEDYVRCMEKSGWKNIMIYPVTSVSQKYLQAVKPTLNKTFQLPDSTLSYLSIILCATKG